MSSASFGTVNATAMNVTGVLQASESVTTRPMQVSNLLVSGTVSAENIAVSGDLTLGSVVVADLSYTGTLKSDGVASSAQIDNATITNISTGGTVDVTGSTGVDASFLTLQGNPIVQGDLTVSGNVYVGGNVFTGLTQSVANVLNTTGLIPYLTQVPDSNDVFALTDRFADAYYYTAGSDYNCYILENEKSFPTKIWNSDRTSIVDHGNRATGSNAYILWYPTNDMNAPRWTPMSDTANVTLAYANIYASAPTDYLITSHLSTYHPELNAVNDPNVLADAYKQIVELNADRGFELPTVDYTVDYNNMFAFGDKTDQFSSTVALEFGYENDGDLVPSNVYLTFLYRTNRVSGALAPNFQERFFNGQFQIMNEANATNSNIHCVPVTVPVVTDPTVFAAAYGSPATACALYDPVKSEIHVYFDGSSNTVSTGNTTPVFNSQTGKSISWNETIEMSAFSGSFAILKKRANVTSSDRPFAPTRSSDPGAFLVQISDTVSFTQNSYVNGTLVNDGDNYNYSSGTRTVSLYASGSRFVGLLLPKVGYGTNSFDIITYYYGSVNAISTDSIASPIGDNPYTAKQEKRSVPANFIIWNSAGLANTGRNINYPGFQTDTPEQLAANLLSSNLQVDFVKTFTTISAHEYTHASVDLNSGIAKRYNIEGMSTYSEMVSQPTIPLILRNPVFAEYVYNLHRGAYPLGRFSKYPYDGDLHTVNAWPGQEDYIRGASECVYGEGMLYTEIEKHYDTNGQLKRRTIDLMANTYFSSMESAGLLPGGIQEASTKLFQRAYNQSIVELTTAQGTPMTLGNVFANFCVSSVMMRNNESIPYKYRFLYPTWLYNRRANYWSDFITSPANYFLTDAAAWSDTVEGRPGGSWPSLGNSVGFNNINDTLVPIWPKVGALFSNGLATNSLGSWADPAEQDAFTYNSNSYVSTPLVHQGEDMSCFSYVVPIARTSPTTVYGTSAAISNISVTVNRGDWVFKVVQFIPNGGAGTFIETPALEINVAGTYSNVTDSWSDGTPVSGEITFTTFEKDSQGADHGDGVDIWYFPRLVCVNRANNDYGTYRNIYPNKCLYSGKMTLQATIV